MSRSVTPNRRRKKHLPRCRLTSAGKESAEELSVQRSQPLKRPVNSKSTRNRKSDALLRNSTFQHQRINPPLTLPQHCSNTVSLVSVRTVKERLLFTEFL